MKILLVAPCPTGRRTWHNLIRMAPNHSLLQVARFTPPGIEIELVDENHGLIDWNQKYDLVGITCNTYQAKRAYWLGDEFRRRGIKVVMGGFHPTFISDECLDHADAVVIGEAEEVWPRVVADARRGRLEPFYQAERPADMKNWPLPRYDLAGLRNYFFFNNYVFLPVTATRGCPFNCDFCSIRRFYRAGFRTRPVEEVIRDFRAGGIRKSYILSDDNFYADRNYARELLRALVPLRVEWIGQCDISIGRDPEMLELARRSGLTMIYLGIETLDQENLREFNKDHLRVEKYPEYLSNLRKAGICVTASVMFGFDRDRPEVFPRMVEFLEKSQMAAFMGYILNPFPGSNFSYRVGQEGRYLDVDLKNWALYDGSHAVHRPQGMSAEELERGYWWAYSQFYSFRSIFRRVFWPPNLSWKPWRGLFFSFRMLFWTVMGNLIARSILKTKKLHPFSGY